METIKAGQNFEGDCPNGEATLLQVGDKLPMPMQATAKVLKVEGSHYVLGPLKAGTIVVSVPCKTSFQDVMFTVEEMPTNEASKRYAPLGTEKVEYPATLFWLILVLFAIPIFVTLLYLFRKRKVKLVAKPDAKKKSSSRDLLENDLAYFEQNVKNPESQHFHQMYKRLRRFIEKELKLKTRSMTTQEFLGTFRALALQQSTNQQLISQLEYILRTTDDVRFAGKVFTPELWRDYLQKIRAILAAFPKTPTAPGVKR